VNPEALFVLAVLDNLCQGRGTFVDHENNEWQEPCPFCGCKSYVAFLDAEWKGNESSPDDVFECFGCGATSTRRDCFGGEHEWDKDLALEELN
jgi:hypothetical protein